MDTSSQARLEYDVVKCRWSFVNESIDGLRILGEAGHHQQIPIGSSSELTNEMQLLLGEGAEARLAYVQLRSLGH